MEEDLLEAIKEYKEATSQNLAALSSVLDLILLIYKQDSVQNIRAIIDEVFREEVGK